MRNFLFLLDYYSNLNSNERKSCGMPVTMMLGGTNTPLELLVL